MADFLTTWTLKLKDLISAPAKAAEAAVDGLRQVAEEYEAGTNKAGEQLAENLEKEKERRKEIIELIEETNEKIVENEKVVDSARTPWNDYLEAQKNLKDAKEQLEYYNEELEKSNEDIEELTGRLEEFTAKHAKIDLVAIKFNQLSEIVEKFARSLQFTDAYKGLRDNIEMMTEAQGAALDDMARKAWRMAKVYNESGDNIAQAANATANRYGISFDDALAKIEEGFKKGANISGDFLNSLKGAQPLQDMGFELDEILAKMISLNKAGMNTGDAFKSFEFANDALRTMDENMQNALSKIGILPESLKGKTVKEALEAIGEAMDASQATVQDKQVLMTQLFGRGGRAMGTAVREGLLSAATALDEIPVVEDTADKIKGFMADVQSWTASVMGTFATSLTQLAPVFTGIGSAITLFQSLTKATWFQTVATKALTVATGIMNVVAKMGPWGWVAAAIGLVTGAVLLLSNKFEWAAGIVSGVKASFMDFGKVILDIVLMPIRTTISSLGALGKAIAALLKGDFDGAVSAAKGAFDPIKDLIKDSKKAAGSFGQGYKKGVIELREKKKSEAAGSTGASDYVADEINFKALDPDKTGGADGKSSKGRGDGMSISGSGGGKALTMNLNIVNNFNGKINSRQDIRDLADEVMGIVVDRSRDMLLNY